MRMHGYGKEALIEVGRSHWREYLPNHYKSLKESGELEQALATAAELTIAEMQSLQSENAMTTHEAWEVAREHFLLLKEERIRNEEPMPISDLYAANAAMNRIPLDPDEE